MSRLRRERRSRSRATSHRSGNVPPPRRTKPGHRHPAWAQSLELLKITVHVTIASVLFLRELLPEEAFGVRCLGKVKPGQMYSHEDFLARQQGTPLEGRSACAHVKKQLASAKTEKPHASKYAGVKIIERGMDEVGDQIRDAMHDIFDGLARRRLGCLQLYIEEASNDGIPPLKLETYTMSFEYGGKRGTADALDGTIDAVLKPRSLRDIQKYIYDMSRKLSMLKDAPAPPSYRSLGILMAYNEDTPSRSVGYGFLTPSGSTDSRGVQAPELDQNWSNIIQPCGRFDGGYHVTELEVSYYRCHALVPFRPSAEPTTERNARHSGP
ncbi:uncharacterized protein N7498_009277 [Penicillium cinerascens]|uniref:HORMA domain-containing protein n=1 Tax=Penicillium cinerascens TaxID=70096 RepID=A0A9W9J5M4_9EURO|nr:uncharacterized protein N7498_009277 [Penicillium cinerascens]KAJ5190292.1 hypothetical protein N7498_009277 [Penicillium cinerascens]